MAEKCINCIALVPLRPIQTLWSRDPETLFGSKSKKTKRFMIFDPKKGGSFFSTFLTPPPLTKNLKKVGFKWGGLGGVRTKNSLGDAFIGQNNDFPMGLN